MKRFVFFLFLISLVLVVVLLIIYSQSSQGLSSNNSFISSLKGNLPFLTSIVPRTVTVDSEHPDYKLSFVNKNGFMKELDLAGFWGEGKVGVNNNDSISWTTAKSLKITLSPEKQSSGGIFSKETGTKKSSFGFAVDSRGKATLSIWINPSFVESGEGLTQLFDSTLLSSLYVITLWPNTGDENSPYFSYLKNQDERIEKGELVLPIIVVNKI